MIKKMNNYTDKEKKIIKQCNEGPFHTLITKLANDEFDNLVIKLINDDDSYTLTNLVCIYKDYNRNKIIDYLIYKGDIDLLFLHQPGGNYKAGYKQLEKAYKEGKIKAIGISNFEGEYILDILNNFSIIPQVEQVECYPYFQQENLRKITEPKNIKIMCWYPLGHGDKSLMEENIITTLANKYNKSTAQIMLKWHIQMGFIVIPGSKNLDHIRDNFDLFDFELTDEEIKKY